MKDKQKVAIIIGIIVVILIIIILIIVNRSDRGKENNINNVSVVERTPISNTRKMSKYIDIISHDYYMEYVEKDQNGEYVTMEYAVLDNKMFMNDEYNMNTIIITKEASYYIMHEYKTIIKYPISDTTQKNILGFQRGYTQDFFESNFRGTGTENIRGVSYYYEEYTDNTQKNNIIRYYFDDNDILKYINNISTANNTSELTEILEISDYVDEQLFELPEEYNEYNAEDFLQDNEVLLQ